MELIVSNLANVNATRDAEHGDFVQTSKLNRLNNFGPYLVGYISGKNWSFVICDWLFVICDLFGSD